VKTYKVLNTEDFRRIAARSIEMDYNRLPTDELLEDLDPDGLHVLVLAMPHEHIGGVRVDPHWRTEWLMKANGRMEPVNLFIDMSNEDYDSIPDRTKEEVHGLSEEAPAAL
jgi:hypothetical protein